MSLNPSLSSVDLTEIPVTQVLIGVNGPKKTTAIVIRAC